MWRKGELPESVYVNHREAKGKVDLDDKAHTLRQLRYVYGAAADRIDMERKYREARLYQVAPISTNMVLSYVGEHVLGMPRSY